MRRGSSIGYVLAAALLLAACGGGQSRAPAPSRAPSPSAASPFSPLPSGGDTAPSAHPPVLASPAGQAQAYNSAADGERFLEANGLTAAAPEATWRPQAVLHVLHASDAGGADAQGDWYFFFAGGRLVGQQFFSRASGQAAVDDSTFAVTYDVFRPGDPHCCPSGGQATVRFHWNGTRLAPLDPISGALQT